jgi:hypothetical protein
VHQNKSCKRDNPIVKKAEHKKRRPRLSEREEVQKMPYTRPNMEYIPKDVLYKNLGRKQAGLIMLINLVYFNKNHPENMVYDWTSTSSNTVLRWRESSDAWEEKSVSDCINEIIDTMCEEVLPPYIEDVDEISGFKAQLQLTNCQQYFNSLAKAPRKGYKQTGEKHDLDVALRANWRKWRNSI